MNSEGYLSMSDDLKLHRQIHPQFEQNGEVGSNAFAPSQSHAYRLSAYDGDQISAEDAYSHFTELGHASCGVQTITEGECATIASLEVDRDGEPFKEHVSIDFSALGSSARKKAAKKLRNFAKKRGWQFQP